MRPLLLVLCLAIAAAAPAAFGDPTSAAGQVRRPPIVTVGDVHGAADEFTAILQRAALIDERKQWIGGRRILVQTGDMTDRGAGMKDALDLLMSLEQQARRAGGRVYALLGNHEVMNLTGEFRDVTPEIVETFGGEAAMRAAFGPKGRYGRWLRGRPAIAKVEGTIFMHAGINPAHTRDSIADINRRIRREIQEWDHGVQWLERERLVSPDAPIMQAVDAAHAEILRMNAEAEKGHVAPDAPRVANLLLPVANIGASSLYDPDGPLWFRGYSTWSDTEGERHIAALLRRHDARRIVTGHTVQPGGRIRARFDQRLFLIDTGMLGRRFFPGGRPSALLLTGDAATPLYLQ